MVRNKRVHVISDLFDPAKGSEFQVAQVALRALVRCGSGPIVLWTTLRGQNKPHIESWLRQNGLEGFIELRLVRLRFSDSLGNHPTVFHFLLDLIFLYKHASSEIPRGEIVWKCGQANVLFNLFSLFWSRFDLLGPIAGLEKPSVGKLAGISLRFRLRYAIYGMALSVSRVLLAAAYRLGRFRYLIVATSHDRIAVPTEFQSELIHYPEVDIDGLIVSVPEVVRVQRNRVTAPRILWAGSLIERKNPLLAVEILSRILAIYPSAAATMIGSGPLRAAVRFAINRSGLGARVGLILAEPISRSEFLKMLGEVDILLVTSVREANSVLVVEALAAGVIVVSTAVSGMCDTVEESGYLFDIGSRVIVESGVDRLLYAIRFGAKSDPRRSLIRFNDTLREDLDLLVSRIIR